MKCEMFQVLVTMNDIVKLETVLNLSDLIVFTTYSFSVSRDAILLFWSLKQKIIAIDISKKSAIRKVALSSTYNLEFHIKQTLKKV